MTFMQTLGEIRTDLAMETHQLVAGARGSSVPGVESYTEEKGRTKVTRVVIQTPEAGQALGKKPGYYVTVESPALRGRDKDELEEVAQVIAEELRTFIAGFQLSDEASGLVVGLGNWNATPDALGPKVVEKVLVTRHLWESAPPEKRGGLRPVCAVSPGVLGITGIETKEIVAGIVQRIKPDFVLVIDALASRSTERVGSTVQIANTGINPGSGVGNHRLGLTTESLGVPVIAIGVPTVVHARTIIHDALEQMAGLGGPSTNAYRKEVIDRVLSPYFQDLIVTPKEIDVLIEDLSRALAGAINIALHPGVTAEEVFRYLE
ncbi:MAG: GPR endopeptidase [Firmicutes bacterium]|nr:GPR endopeptidase [Bacillota bacterium]